MSKYLNKCQNILNVISTIVCIKYLVDTGHFEYLQFVVFESHQIHFIKN